MNDQSLGLPDDVPVGLNPPIDIDVSKRERDLWIGDGRLLIKNQEFQGATRVFIDFVPQPSMRFTLTPPNLGFSRERFENPPLGIGSLEAGTLIGTIPVLVTKASDRLYGSIEGRVPDFGTSVSCATFLVLNGPRLYGTAIRRDRTIGHDRSVAKVPGLTITMDALPRPTIEAEAAFNVTHVVQCRFDDPANPSELNDVATELFQTLSLMRCRWVGLVGPWIYDSKDALIGFAPAVTKVTPDGNTLSWCVELIEEAFSLLFSSIHSGLRDAQRMEALRTTLHWLVEAEQCAGGVEGSVILQQAALECLAWLEIVQVRGLCSESGFNRLPANDKIRWLLSLHQITSQIAGNAKALQAFASEFGLKDLPDVIIHVRNSLVHAEPKKLRKLLSRSSVEDECTEVWYHAGGILQQALLASLKYQGRMMRRDVDAKYTSNAIRRVPWATGG